MKKLLSLLLAIFCLTALVACNTNDEDTEKNEKATRTETSATDDTSVSSDTASVTEKETEEETRGEVAIPDGYVVYENDALSFAYPKDWVKQDGSIVILQDAATGNNITVVSESKNAFYDTMTLKDFDTQMKPAYEAMGMTVENVKLERKTTATGMKILVVSFDNTTQGMTMTQTQYVTTIGDYSYTVTVTEVTPDATLVQNVFETLSKK